eukprot:596227-Rhodomonas_salina.1
MYKIYNGLLRDLLRLVNEQLQHEAGQTVTTARVRVALAVARERMATTGYVFVTSVLVLVSALVKLRTVSDLPESRKLYRGTAGLKVPACFTGEDARGNRGG